MKLIKFVNNKISTLIRSSFHFIYKITLTRNTRIFLEQNKLGSEVKIFQTNGQENSGKFVNFGRDYIVLRINSGNKVTILTKTITSYIVLNEHILKHEKNAQDVENTQIKDDKSYQFFEISSKAISVQTQTEAITSESVSKIYDIEGRFQTAIQTAKSSFKIKIPDFNISLDEISSQDKKLWDSIIERYKYAKRNKELNSKFDRINRIISDLEKLNNNYPSSSTIKRHLAYFYSLLEKWDKAIEYYQDTVFLSNALYDWFNLAVVAWKSNRYEITCYSLEQFLSQRVFIEEKDAWFIYTSLLEILTNYPAFKKLYQATEREILNDEFVLLLETGIYLIKTAVNQQEAEKFVQRWIRKEPLKLVLEDILNYIDTNLYNSYDDYHNFTLEYLSFKSQIIEYINSNKQKKEFLTNQKEGYIFTYKKTKGYGSLRDVKGNQFNFNHRDIQDDALLTILAKTTTSQFQQGNRIAVFFELANDGFNQSKVVKLCLRSKTDNLAEEEQHEKVLKDILQDSNAYVRALSALLVKQDLEKAAEFFRQAIDKRDNFEKSIECIARVLEELGRIQEAINIVARYLPQLTEQKLFEDLLLRMYLKLEQYKNSAILLEKQIEVTKNNGKKCELLWKLVSCYIRYEDFEHAENKFKKILELQPNNTEVKKDIVLCLLKQQKYEESKYYLNEIFDKNDELEIKIFLEKINKLKVKEDFDNLQKLISNQLDEIASSQLKPLISDSTFSKFITHLQIDIKIKEILKTANKLASFNRYSEAIYEVRKVFSIDPENLKAKEFEKEFIEAQRKQSVQNLKNKNKNLSVFNQGKEALDTGNLEEAERLLIRAIKEGDRHESAIKELAALKQRKNQHEEAIHLLQNYKHKAKDKVAILRVIANIHQSLGRYKEAILTLQEVLALTPNNSKNNVLKQIAFAYYNLQEYEESEKIFKRVLQQNPSDETARSRLELLDFLRENNQIDMQSEWNAWFAQEAVSDAQFKLGDFLNFHLEQCNYEGIEAEKKQSKLFTERDVEKLTLVADKKLSIKRPDERAKYYLSAAKIQIHHLGSEPDETQPREYLRNFCAAMGDACILNNKDNDVAQGYYAEAFRVAPDWIDQLEVKLLQYIRVYYSTAEDVLTTDRRSADVESSLEQALKIPNLGRIVIEGLLYLSWLNRDLGYFLIRKITPNKHLRAMVESYCCEILGEKANTTTSKLAFLQLWKRGEAFIDYRERDIRDELVYLHSAATRLDSLENQISRVQNIKQKLIFKIDRNRLNQIQIILNNLYEYSQNTSYSEREYYKDKIKNRIKEFLEEVKNNPTKYSWELFHPYVISLGETIEKHFNQIQLEAEPEQLKTEFVIDSYPDKESIIECQIRISNEEGKSTASSIKIKVKNSPANEYIPQQEYIAVSEFLEGGKSVTCYIPINVSQTAKESRFTLYYQLSYKTRTGKRIDKDHSEAISLYSAKDFKQINNPYSSYAQGNIVEEENMFYGRDMLIANLILSIHNSSSKKSFMFYGQKRTGKSSILYHLQQKLTLPIIPVRFSIQGGDMSFPNFLYQIALEINEAFDDLNYQRYPSISIKVPPLEELKENPQMRFQEYMSELRKKMREIDEYRDAKIMLLIDEFSYIYGLIKRGIVPDIFMQFWKALLEKGYFGTVLVGQDYMPKFINSFPNEFQIAENQRVSYLAREDAEKLIIKPIIRQENQESRYKGNAVNRLIDLTAGSPYYIQIFCNRLVEYMNRKKLDYVTEADIDRIKDDLINGNNSLDGGAFDNLTSAGDNNTDNISKDDAEAVLHDIANGSRLQPYCDRSAITAHTSANIDDVLKDLETRQVIEKQGTGFRIKVELFKEWLLKHQ
ncbi:tetratricopeptide repeat protein [Nostoc sp. FACHB-190]|nr:tetratricopeptide repeat protein [Nostoc sp. FACHB-190]